MHRLFVLTFSALLAAPAPADELRIAGDDPLASRAAAIAGVPVKWIPPSAGAIGGVLAGDADLAIVPAGDALRARAGGAAIKGVYLLPGERVLVAAEKHLAQPVPALAPLLRAVDAQARASGQPVTLPGPRAIEHLALLAGSLAAGSDERATLTAAAATLIDRNPARAALARIAAPDARCASFCDHW